MILSRGLCFNALLVLPVLAPSILLAQSSARDACAGRDGQSLRVQAQERIGRDRAAFSDVEFTDIESRYLSAQLDGRSGHPLPTMRDVLVKLIDDYPTSNRAGCALVDLASLSRAAQRESYLLTAIEQHPDAWYEDGVQVAAMARAKLALRYADAGRMDDADRVARELNEQFPCAVDHQGERLTVVENALKLLRPPH